MHDNINHPKHYNYGDIEPIDVIEDWPSHGRDEQKIYDRMNY